MAGEPRTAAIARKAVVASARNDRLAKERNLLAQVWRDDFIRVRSATTDDWHLVSVEVLPSGRLEFGCDHPVVHGGGIVFGEPGQTCCSHQAAAADLLAGLGWASWNGVRWTRSID